MSAQPEERPAIDPADYLPITAEGWKDLHHHLIGPFGRVEFWADGYVVTASVQQVKPLRFVIATYVDGYIRGAWMREDREETRKFWRRQEAFLWKKADRERMAKLTRSRHKDLRKFGEGWDKKVVTWTPYWPTPEAFLRQVRKQCQDVRIVKLGVA